MKKIFFGFLISQALLIAPAWGSQESYLACKEQALQNLATRYTQFFQSDTGGATGAASTTQTFMNDYQSAGKNACSSQFPDTSSKDYMNCLDGAINSAATRFSTQFTSKINTTGNTSAQDTYQNYQKDYNAAEVICRNELVDGSSCAAAKQSVVQACTGASQDATTACNPNQNSGLQSLQTSLNNISSSGGIQQACQQVASMSDQGTQAVNSYSADCSGKKSTCLSKCQSAMQALSSCQNVESTQLYQAAHTSMDSCSILQAKTSEAQQLVQSFQDTKKSALNCANQTGTDGTASASSTGTTNSNGTNANGQQQQDPTTAALAGLTQAAVAAMNQPAASPTPIDPSQIPSTDPNSAYCQAHPTVAGCVADCSRTDLPAIASSHTCICFRNPTDPSCTSASASGLQLSSMSQGGGTSTTATAASTDPNLAGIDGGFQGFQTSPSQGGSGQDIGGKQGNGANIGGGSGLSPAGASSFGGGGGSVSDTPRIGGGFYGGSAGGSNPFSNGTGNGGGGGGAFATSASNGSTGSGRVPDLRQFLPGGRLDPAAKRRGIAGVSGPDGITGPEVENWNKIQNRYRFLESSLLP